MPKFLFFVLLIGGLLSILFMAGVFSERPAEPEKVSYSPYEIERLVNIERTNHGLTSLVWNNDLREVAYNHSLDMARNDFFTHVNLKGQNMTDRGIAMGYNCRPGGVSGENLFMVEGYDKSEIPSIVVEAWMDSPEHKEVILTEWFRYGAVGIVEKSGVFYITHNFAVCIP